MTCVFSTYALQRYEIIYYSMNKLQNQFTTLPLDLVASHSVMSEHILYTIHIAIHPL